MEQFDKMKNNPTYSVIIAKHAHGKGLNFFCNFLQERNSSIFCKLL